MIKRFLLILILFYQKIISPYLRPSCKYIPSCSEYSKSAVIKYGPVKGSFLSIWRIIRCNPFTKKIYDPLI